MKVTAATLLTLLAAAPSAYAANTRRLGAADVSDIDNRRLSMDLIETAAVEPAGKEASAKMTSSMMAATADGPPPEAAALIAKIIEVLGELGVDMPEQASGVEPAVFNGPIIDAIIESILEALFGYGGSKSGKGSKSGDHDYYYYEGGESKSGKGESKSAKGESKSVKGA